MKSVSKLLSSLIVVYLCFSLTVPPGSSLASGLDPSGALTPPPPIIFTPLGFFDPSFIYLDQGDSSIVDNGDQTVTINVSTVAKQTVASIGASIYLEKWSGSAWVQIGSPAHLSASNKMMFSGYATFNVVSGYYYRARTVHWTSHGGIYEQGERLTNNILAS